MHLLDINVLIALCDSEHIHHQRSQDWFLSLQRDAWSTCPITENGFIRIVGQSAYMNFDGGTEDARAVLRVLIDTPGHQFWADDLSLADENTFPTLSASKYLTDQYLLALSIHHGAQLATLDERIDPMLVGGGTKGYFLVPG